MRNVLTATVTAAMLAIAAPAAFAAPERPPTDPVIIGGGSQGCQPDYPCTIEPITITPDKTYPNRLVTWAKEQLP